MKKILIGLFLALVGITSFAETYINESQIDPHFGYIRKSPCQQFAGDNCGSEPPTWHVTPDQCGFIFSSSSSRNEGYQVSLNGTGVQTAFDVPFPYLNTSHLEVLVGGVLKTLGVDYTVSAPGNSGTVTFTTPPPAGSGNVLIRLEVLWNGTGVQTVFNYNFPIHYIESLEVKVGGVLKTFSTDYTISGIDSPTGGTVTFLVAPAAGTDNVSIKMVSLSTKGFKITVPTVAEFNAAGYFPSGASAATTSDKVNREGQCRIGLLPAAPSPQNYGIIGIDGGVLGTDKFTNIWEGGPSIDFYDGHISFPEGWGIIWYVWNGTSWLYDGGSGSQGERVSMGQMAAQGQGRLFVVTADPSWWSVSSKVGHLAYCPTNGRGLVTNSNDHTTLSLLPINCVYAAPNGSSVDYAQVTQNTGTSANNVTEGAAYIAGTSPDGTPYPAGKYVVIVMVGAVNTIVDGSTVSVVSLPMTNGTRTTGKWIVKRLTPGVDPGCAGGSAACLELHEAVEDWNQNKVWGIGPPSRFVAGDTMRNPGTVFCCMSHALSTVALAGGRRTDPVSGSELVGNIAAPEGSIVGVVQSSAGVFNDTVTNRQVASWYNPVEKKCQFSPSVDKTTTSLTFVEVDSTTRCTFVYADGIGTRAIAAGDTGRRVRYAATVGAANNTAGDGCEFAIAFDSITAEETAPPGFVNPAGVVGGMQTVTVTGSKSGLTNNTHTGRLLFRAKTGGTCTVFSANTEAVFWILQ